MSPSLKPFFVVLITISYASLGRIFWPFLRSSVQAPTIEAVRRTVAIEGVFDNSKGQLKGS